MDIPSENYSAELLGACVVSSVRKSRSLVGFTSAQTRFFLYEVRNSYFDERILLKNDKSLIYSDYEFALLTAYREGRF